MIEIRLRHDQWYYDPGRPLGEEGGFGRVYEGRSSSGDLVAVKRLHIRAAQTAHRELRIAEDLSGREFQHVMQFLDFGLDAESDSYFFVMPLAEQSLQAHIAAEALLSEMDACHVMLQVLNGLREVPQLVHRDLKPANVLLHENRWKIADFGIARFVEESTSLETLRDRLTPAYAAPEQWQVQRATSATDLYALGCIGYALLTGEPPFRGPELTDYRNQHLSQEPPSPPRVRPLLQSLLLHLLRKTAVVRPSPERVSATLEQLVSKSATRPDQPGMSALAEAGALAAGREAEKEASEARERKLQEDRQLVAKEALGVLAEVTDYLFGSIQVQAANAAVAGFSGSSPGAALLDKKIPRVGLEGAELQIHALVGGAALPKEAFSQCRWETYAGAVISVRQRNPRYERSACLWFTNLGKGPACRWFELSYCAVFGMAQPAKFEPFALTDLREAAAAAAPGIHHYQLAHRPWPVDAEDVQSFCDRWAGFLAAAVKGELTRPRSLPIEQS
jgi:serine/threonine-protein kinase